MAAKSPSIGELIDRGFAEIDISELRAALASAGDEDDRWEIKGTDLRPEHVYRAVAGLGNNIGGILILGASRSGDTWQLEGRRFPGEPGPWIEQVIRDNLSPAPPFRIQIYNFDSRSAAVVQVERHAEHLSIDSKGRVFRRQHGRTAAIADGAELTRVVQERAAPLQNAVDIDLHARELAMAVEGTAAEGRIESLRPAISGLESQIIRAAQFEPEAVLDEEADKLASLAATLIAEAPRSEITDLALTAHHRAFDAGVRFRLLPTERSDLDLYRVVIRNARTLGALLVRLELWDAVRLLALHRATQYEDVYPGWFSFIKSRQSHARGYPANAETLRWPLRSAKDAALRISALHPDRADEHQLLDSVLNFEFLVSLIELDQCSKLGLRAEVSCDFATFLPESQRPLVARLFTDEAIKSSLLPEVPDDQIALHLLNLDQLARQQAAGSGERWGGLVDSLTLRQLQSAIAA